jgi:predicted RNase H-like nuclease
VAFLESRKPPLTAGLLLGEALCARGFELDPLRLRPAGDGRFALEMYPHAFHVVAFGLSERLAYKKGRRGRRLEAFAAYQAALRLLAAALAPSLLHERAIAAVLDGEALRAHGAALKSLEDRLDAFTCALAALTAWRLGIEPADVFGDRRTGYIAVPGLHREPRFMARMMSG